MTDDEMNRLVMILEKAGLSRSQICREARITDEELSRLRKRRYEEAVLAKRENP